MRWFTFTSKPKQEVGLLTFDVRCTHCAEKYQVVIGHGVTQSISGLCPACTWYYETFEMYKSEIQFYLSYLEKDMLATLDDWASLDKWNRND